MHRLTIDIRVFVKGFLIILQVLDTRILAQQGKDRIQRIIGNGPVVIQRFLILVIGIDMRIELLLIAKEIAVHHAILYRRILHRVLKSGEDQGKEIPIDIAEGNAQHLLARGVRLVAQLLCHPPEVYLFLLPVLKQDHRRYGGGENKKPEQHLRYIQPESQVREYPPLHQPGICQQPQQNKDIQLHRRLGRRRIMT